MRRLVVNADDFGLSPGVNDGILAAHAEGIVTSASLMVLAPGAEHAAELTRSLPALSVGLHFVDDGSADLDDPAQAARAFAAQVARFRELIGDTPTHVDSHHHVHSSGQRLPSFAALVEPLGVPLRHDGRVAYIGDFWAQSATGLTELDHVRRPFLLELIADKAGEGLTELACHPARLTGDFSSSYLDERAVELATLTEPGLRAEISALGVSLVSYRAWASRS